MGKFEPPNFTCKKACQKINMKQISLGSFAHQLKFDTLKTRYQQYHKLTIQSIAYQYVYIIKRHFTSDAVSTEFSVIQRRDDLIMLRWNDGQTFILKRSSAKKNVKLIGLVASSFVDVSTDESPQSFAHSDVTLQRAT